jgi:hypothetical protein
MIFLVASSFRKLQHVLIPNNCIDEKYSSPLALLSLKFSVFTRLPV